MKKCHNQEMRAAAEERLGKILTQIYESDAFARLHEDHEPGKAVEEVLKMVKEMLKKELQSL